VVEAKVMRVAVPVWGERVSPVFDTAGVYLVVDFEDRREASRRLLEMGGDPLSNRLEMLKNIKPEVLLCGAISRPLFDMLVSSGIEVIPFLSGSVEDVLTAFLEDGLSDPTIVMPGCCGQRRRRRLRWQERGRGGKERT
jgi:predicted Fe-Mo cluster-binding NifX family protein